MITNVRARLIESIGQFVFAFPFRNLTLESERYRRLWCSMMFFCCLEKPSALTRVIRFDPIELS